MRLRFIISLLIIIFSAPAQGGFRHTAAQTKPHRQEHHTRPDINSEIASLTARLKSTDEEERRHAVLMLAATGDRGAQPALVGALDDPSERVRAAAATGLGSLGDPAMVEPLAARLAKDKKPFVRKAAAYAIGHFSSHDGTSALVATLKDKDAEVRGAAAVALGRYADAQAVAGLTAALTDKYDFVRARAAHALGVNGRAAAQAVPQLVTLLTSDKDNEVRRQAATSLGLIGERSALPALNQAQHDPDPYLSLAALDAIRRIETGARN